MLGLAALAYAAIHLALYVIDQNFDLGRVASEIVLRVYLTIGFVTLVGLVTLGATSTDTAIRRMGAAWRRLHRIVYVLAVLAIVHFFLQSKADVSEATLMSGLFGLLMAYRAMHKRGVALAPLPLALVAVAATAATIAIEFVWYWAATGIDPTRVFLANFDFSYTIRPAWWVGATGLAVAVTGAVRKRPAGSKRGWTFTRQPAE
jgi:sulfoxide reductase heme-binding subunit YedZ